MISPLGHWRPERGPGVYRQELTSHLEAPLQTGVPAMLGRAHLRAEVGSSVVGMILRGAQLQTLIDRSCEDQKQRLDPFLCAAVQGFFENGGASCAVVLIDDPSLHEDEGSTAACQRVERTLSEGLEACAGLDQTDLLAAPFLAGLRLPSEDLYALQGMMLDFCGKTDRFALLDPIDHARVSRASGTPAHPTEGVLGAVRAQLQALGDQEHRRNGALYFPWVWTAGGPSCWRCAGSGRLRSGRCPTCSGGGTLLVPPSGHVAGVFSRVDRQAGVFQAPANEALQGVIDLEVNVGDALLRQLQEDEWGNYRVNCLRAVPGRGIRIWGARTLSEESTWRSVSVRRLFLTVKSWLERTLSNVVFEPNDLRVWMRVTRELTAYFDQLFQAGALKGQSASDAFYVKCDGETNPQQVRDRGLLVAEIGLAPVTPREFIIIRLVRGADGLSMTGLG